MEEFVVTHANGQLVFPDTSAERACFRAHMTLGPTSLMSVVGKDTGESVDAEFLNGFSSMDLTQAAYKLLLACEGLSTGKEKYDQQILALRFFLENTMDIGFPTMGSEKLFVDLYGATCIPDEVLHKAFNLARNELTAYEQAMIVSLLRFGGGYFNNFVASRCGNTLFENV